MGELVGRAPYFNNPDVHADIFDLTTGALKEANAIIPVPGTFKTWRWIQPPVWSGEPEFDPKAERILLDVPFELNKKVSRLGARWSDVLDSWWIAEDNATALGKLLALGVMRKT
ncbi:MAG: hypothetical protein K2X55_07555 [Burkholderiaceae bacterium]|nr:hypothetical protein [Burkholderiaceae bacterium]